MEIAYAGNAGIIAYIWASKNPKFSRELRHATRPSRWLKPSMLVVKESYSYGPADDKK